MYYTCTLKNTEICKLHETELHTKIKKNHNLLYFKLLIDSEISNLTIVVWVILKIDNSVLLII